MTDIVNPPSMTAPPEAPVPTDTQDDFSSKAFSLAAWFSTMVTQMTAALANVLNNATAAQERATAAGSSASTADDHRIAAQQARTDAQGYAAAAVNAPGTSGTSSTSTAVGSGTKTLTTQTGKAWVVGQPVVISRTSAPTTIQMYGVISAYNGGTGSISVVVPDDGVVGSGTFSDWTIALTGRRGMAGVLPVLETTGDTVGVYGFCYHIMGNHKLTLPALGTVDQEIEFYNMSGLTTPTVEFGSTKLTTITGIKTPGLMTLEFPGCGARLRSTANATYGFRA